ncbi:MAG: hypothetical protein WBK91_09600 [Alphaproteobacteria bacterium]
MIDAVGGSAIATQLRSASPGVEAIRNEREQTEAVVRTVERTTREIPRNDESRGRNVDVRA